MGARPVSTIELTRTATPAALPPPAAPPRPPGPARGGRQWALVALIGLSVVALAHLASRRVPTYLTADSGHYLADADAILGGGVREPRHLPLFPLLLGAFRLVVTDLVAVRLAMAVVVLVLVGGFAALVHGRLADPRAEVVGVLFFALSPLMAEGIGWYGASMMLGFGLVLIALRLVDDALRRPTWRRGVAWGAVLGLSGLAHPLPLALGVQAIVLAAGILVLRDMVVRRGGQAPSGPGVGRQVLVVAGGGLVAGLLLLTQVGFYTRLQPPLHLAFDAGRLADLVAWAFRDSVALWFALLVLVVLLVPGGRALAGERGLRLGVWASAVLVVSVASVALTGGHPSYVSRYVYALPVAIGCAAAVAAGLAGRATSWPRARWGRYAVALLTVVLAASLVRATQSFWLRTTEAIPYYNFLTDEEREAIGRLGRGGGTVAVTHKGADRTAGTLYAWMIEGLARTRAIGTGDAFLSVLPEAHRDSLDVERLVAGSLVVEAGGLRLSASEARPAAVDVAGRVGDDWFPMATVSAGPVPLSGGRPAVAATLDPEPAVFLSAGTLELRVALPRGRAEVVVEVAGGPPDLTLVEVVPDPFATGVTLREVGDRVVISRLADSAPVDLEVTAPAQGRTRIEQDQRTGNARVRVESGGGDGGRLVLRFPVSGVTAGRDAPALFRERDLIGRHRVTRLFTWRDHRVPVLARRDCFEPVHVNREVMILEVVDLCRVP